MTLRLVATRVGHALLSMALLTLAIFFLVRLTGDPTRLLLPEFAPEEVRQALREELGLNKPLIVQYGIFMGNLFQGDLGTSFMFRVPVSELIAQRFPATISLAISAITLTLLVGVPLGTIAAYKRNSPIDRVASWLAIFGQSAPDFWVGLILILIFAINFGVLPPGGMGGPANFILPTVVMALGAVAGLVRLIRSSMIEVLETDYAKFLRLKGLPERKVLWKHGLRNAGLSALTFVGILTATLFAGSVVAETVFAWPGMGWLISESIVSKDFAVVQGVVLVFSMIYIVINLCTDLLYGFLDPRMK